MDIKEHLEKEHAQTTVAAYLKEIVYGGIDGIVTTFAVVAGFSGAAVAHSEAGQLSFLVVLLFGFANLCADGVSMGLSNFLSVRSNKQLYTSEREKEINEIRVNPEAEAEESAQLLIAKGFSPQEARTLVSIYRHNEEYWADWMMTHELKMHDPSGENPVHTGLATFFAFIAFGCIPLVPFIFAGAGKPVLFSILGSLIALALLGFLKARTVGGQTIYSILEVILVGSLAGTTAFFVGSLFRL